MAQSLRSSDGARGIYRLEEPPVEEFCGGVDCYLADAQLSVLLLVVGFLGFAALFAFLYLKDARTVCRREIKRVRSERDAFDQFARRVADLDATRGPGRISSNAGQTLAAASNTRDGTRRVKRLFNETVMDVDHYDEEYGESFETHFAVELGDQVRTLVNSGGKLTVNKQRAIVANAKEARERRALLAEAIEREHDTVVDARDLLRDATRTVEADRETPLLERDFETLRQDWERLDGTARDCDRLVDRRQQRIHAGVAVPGQRWDGIEFCQYLYGSLDVRHPVLASTAVVLDRIQSRQRALSTALTRRV